jgi:acyl-CoA thioester hydrolase
VSERPFTLLLRVRYAECDAQRVVFHSRYSEYADVAVTEFIRALGFGHEAATGALEYQLVRQTVEWRGPARFDEVLALEVEATRLGQTSFTVTTTFRLAGADPVIATAETVYVMVDLGLRKQPLPPAFRQALERGARGTVTDHAAWRPGGSLHRDASA